MVLFAIGTIGVLVRRNILVILLSVEIMLNAGNLALVAGARALGLMQGHVMVFFVMAMAAAESAVGLAILISLYRNKETVDVEHVRMLRW